MRFWRRGPKEGPETPTIEPDTPTAPELSTSNGPESDEEPTPTEELIAALVVTTVSALTWLGLDKATQFTAELAQEWGAAWAYFLLDIAKDILAVIPPEWLEKPIAGLAPWALMGIYIGFITTVLEKLPNEGSSPNSERWMHNIRRVLQCTAPSMIAIWAGLSFLQEPTQQEQILKIGTLITTMVALFSHILPQRLAKWAEKGGIPKYGGIDPARLDVLRKIFLVIYGETVSATMLTWKLIKRFETLLAATATLAAYFATQTPEISHRLYLLAHDIIMFVSDSLFFLSLIFNTIAVVAAMRAYTPFAKLLLSKAKEPH